MNYTARKELITEEAATAPLQSRPKLSTHADYIVYRCSDENRTAVLYYTRRHVPPTGDHLQPLLGLRSTAGCTLGTPSAAAGRLLQLDFLLPGCGGWISRRRRGSLGQRAMSRAGFARGLRDTCWPSGRCRTSGRTGCKGMVFGYQNKYDGSLK